MVMASENGDIHSPVGVIDTISVQKTTRDSGVKMINSFEVIRNLGKGAFGKVKLCLDTRGGSDKLYAIKIMDKTVLKKKRQGMSNMLQSVQKEIAIMKKLSHPNCVRLYEVIDDPSSNKLYLRLEFVTGGQCMPSENGTEPLPLDVAQRHFSDLISGLEYLHVNHVLHRDIKPENLLVCKETGVLKLADFGVSQTLEGSGGPGGGPEEMISKSAGTPAFMAPECCVPGAFHGKLADIWAAGVSLYFFVHGRCPFVSPNVMQLYDMIVQEEITYDEALPAPLLDLLRGILNKDPSQRLRLEQIKAHPWFLQQSAPAPTRVGVTRSDVASAFTLSMQVVLMCRIKHQMKKALNHARINLAHQHHLAAGIADDVPPATAADASEGAVQAVAVRESERNPIAESKRAVIPDGMEEYVDSDLEDADTLGLINEMEEAVEQADGTGQLHMQRQSSRDGAGGDAGDQPGDCNQQ